MQDPLGEITETLYDYCYPLSPRAKRVDQGRQPYPKILQPQRGLLYK